MLLIHLISGIMAALITGKLVNSFDSGRKDNKNNVQEVRRYNHGNLKRNTDPPGLSSLVTASIEEAAILCIKVSGYIVFFAVISELLSLLGVFSLLGELFSVLFTGSLQSARYMELMTALLKGFMEITSGAQAIYNLKGIQLNIQLAVVSIIFGFAGFSVHTQIMGIMKSTGSKYRVLFLGKLLHGIIAGITAFLAIQIMPMSIQTSEIDAVSNIGLLWTALWLY